MRRLGHALAAVQKCLGRACTGCLLGGEHVGQQIDRLDIAILETQILHAVQRCALILGSNADLLCKHQEIRLYTRGIFVLTGGCTARNLQVKQQLLALGYLQKAVDLRKQLLARHVKRNVRQAAAVIKSVDVQPHCKRLFVEHQHGIVHRVTVKHRAIAQRDGHLIVISDLSVKICLCRHKYLLLFGLLL